MKYGVTTGSVAVRKHEVGVGRGSVGERAIVSWEGIAWVAEGAGDGKVATGDGLVPVWCGLVSAVGL